MILIHYLLKTYYFSLNDEYLQKQTKFSLNLKLFEFICYICCQYYTLTQIYVTLRETSK